MNTAEKSYSMAETAITRTTEADERIHKLEDALKTAESKHSQLHEHLLRIESQSRRDNLRFDGIKEERGEDCVAIIQDIITNMDIDVKQVRILRAHRSGPFRHLKGAPRPIVVEFPSCTDRERVWSKRNALKGTHIWLGEDFPNEIQDRRRKLWPYLRAARDGDPNNNPNTRVTANLRVDKLIINNQAYNVDNLHLLPDFVKNRVANRPTMKKTDELTLFFSGHCAFSNFHLADIEIDDTKYSSVEQYLSYKKAMLFDNEIIADEIMKIHDPKIQKQKARNLKGFNYDQWQAEAKLLLKPALMAKFQQHDHLRRELLATGESILGEANPHDKLFGIGLPLNHPDAVIVSSWPGDNIQGTALMSVRDALK
jgi:ribA/ribD-fused uncharacterized protein